MLSQQKREELELATICSDCKWGIFYREEHDGLTVRMEDALCGHPSALLGRNYVTGEYQFKICADTNRDGNCPTFEPKPHPDMHNVISHDGVMSNEEIEEEEDDTQ